MTKQTKEKIVDPVTFRDRVYLSRSLKIGSRVLKIENGQVTVKTQAMIKALDEHNDFVRAE